MADVFVTDSQQVVYPVQDGDLLLPLQGNWTAQLNFGGATTVPTGLVQLTWYDTVYNGYVIRSGIQNSQGTASLAGGKGGLYKTNPTKMYDYNLAAQLPFQEILADSGETLSTTANAQILATMLPNWVRRGVTAGQQIADLVGQLGTLWCVANDGGIYVGPYDWLLANAGAYTLQDHDPTINYTIFNALSASIRPGQTIPIYGTTYQIGCVHYHLTSTGTTAQLWYLDQTVNTGVLDPLHQGLAQFVRETISQIDYYALYSGKVVVQRSDGTLDVILDNPKIPPLTTVPLAYPWPGAKINVQPDQRVLIGFQAGNPTLYTAQLWLDGQGGLPIARKTDPVGCGSLVITAVAMDAITGTYTPPGGMPVPFSLGTPITLQGVITGGSSTIEDSSL